MEIACIFMQSMHAFRKGQENFPVQEICCEKLVDDSKTKDINNKCTLVLKYLKGALYNGLNP